MYKSNIWETTTSQGVGKAASTPQTKIQYFILLFFKWNHHYHHYQTYFLTFIIFNTFSNYYFLGAQSSSRILVVCRSTRPLVPLSIGWSETFVKKLPLKYYDKLQILTKPKNSNSESTLDSVLQSFSFFVNLRWSSV